MTLAIQSIGTFTSVGTTLGETMGSLSVSLAMFQEIPFVGPDGDPIVAAPTPLSIDGVLGMDRLLGMAAFALAECARGYETEPVPLLLCGPEAIARTESFTKELAAHASVRIDPRLTRAFPHGRASIATALAHAEEILATRQAAACYIGGVDSLIQRDQLAALVRAERIKSGGVQGFIPGEGSAFLRVAARADANTWGLIAGAGAAEEPATRDSGRTNTGVGLARAMQLALGRAGMSMSQVSFLAHDVSGERFAFDELAFATVRMRPKKMEKWTATLSVGEIGAAIGPLSIGYLAFLHKTGGWNQPLMMFATASDENLRGAVAVLPPPEKIRGGTL